MNSKMTRKKAIDAFCKMCIHDTCEKGTWRQQVEACPATECPLFKFRPRPVPRSKPKEDSQ